MDLPDAYATWLRQKASDGIALNEFHICNYPFVFDAEAKTKLLEVDQAIQMYYARMRAQNQAAFSLFFNPALAMSEAASQFLVFHVTRENIVRDTLLQVCTYTVRMCIGHQASTQIASCVL